MPGAPERSKVWLRKTRTMHRCLLLTLVVLLPLTGCSGATPEPVCIFAAASTQEALERIRQDFTAQSGTVVETNLGASSDLARQIEHGAAADLFLSADETWADYLATKGLVE